MLLPCAHGNAGFDEVAFEQRLARVHAYWRQVTGRDDPVQVTKRRGR